MIPKNQSVHPRIEPLTPDRISDYIHFFEKVAFVDNPDWASCYCYFPHAPHETCSWKERTGEENRRDSIQCIQQGKLTGYLAYMDSTPIGWCNAGLRANATITPDYPEPDEDKIGSIACFIIARDYRRKGVARALLNRACRDFYNMGLLFAEGYPLEEMSGDAANHWGPLELYLSEGFQIHKKEDDMITVRKLLT